MSFHRPFPGIASLARPAVAALVLLAPALMPSAPARAAQPVALSDSTRLAAAPTAGSIASIDQPNPLPPKSLAAKAIDKVKEAAQSAGDIFSRVPCLPPKGGLKPIGTLQRVAGKLAAGRPVVIVAFGSSSTQGYGST
jgi:hypothetical protein